MKTYLKTKIKMNRLLFIFLGSLLFSCKQSECYYVEYCDTITFYDTIIFPTNHIHHPSDTLCCWSDADTIPICVELPYKILIPVKSERE